MALRLPVDAQLSPLEQRPHEVAELAPEQLDRHTGRSRAVGAREVGRDVARAACEVVADDVLPAEPDGLGEDARC